MRDVLARRRFTVDEYHRMGEAGILSAGECLELINGEVVRMPRTTPRHAGSVNRLVSLWAARLGARAVVHIRNPVRLPAYSELQPDLALLRPRADFYATSYPEASDVLLVVEVSDTTLEMDRRIKIPLYARYGIREAWLLDLTRDRLEVYRHPTPDGYRDVRVVERGQPVTAEAFPDMVLRADDLIG
jgi:Uma2 family endonuclease